MQDQDTDTPKKRKYGQGIPTPLHPNPLFASHGFSITFQDRFWAKVDKTETCWNWTGCFNNGYGWIWAGKGNSIIASRASWILTNGEIPEGMDVLHSCDNPRCVNPNHTFLGTQRDNNYDMVSKNRQYRKFTAQQVIGVRSDYAGGMSKKQLIEKYSISSGNVCAILSRRTWKHI